MCCTPEVAMCASPSWRKASKKKDYEYDENKMNRVFEKINKDQPGKKWSPSFIDSSYHYLPNQLNNLLFPKNNSQIL